MLGIWNDVFYANGGDEFIGRSLVHRLQCLGAKDVKMKIHVEAAQIREYHRTQLLWLLKSMRDPILASGRISNEGIEGPYVRFVGASCGSEDNTN